MAQRMKMLGIGGRMIVWSATFGVPALIIHLLFPQVFSVPVPLMVALPLGAVLFASGIGLLAWSGRVFMGPFKNGELVTCGPYRYIRNPIYAAWIFFLIPALAVFARSWLVFLTVAVAVAAFMKNVRIEEKTLTDLFGDEYRNYCARTGRLLPFRYLSRTFFKSSRRTV